MKKEGNTTTLTRDELYDLVWLEPVIKVAKVVGVSDVAVANACRRHKIPLPGRGYWRRLETGHKVSRQPLPKTDSSHSASITFTAGNPNLYSQLPRPELKGKNIVVAEDPDELHPLARQALVEMTQKEVDGRGLTVPGNTLDIRVSKQQLSRAIRIMDALIKAIEELGHRIEIKSYRENRGFGYKESGPVLYKTEAKIKGVAFTFNIEESVKRLPHVPTKSEERELARGNKWKVPEFDYIPTGDCAFQIKDCYLYGLRGTWSDGKRQRLEDLVSSFIQGVLTTADAEIARELERQNERKRKEEAERRRIEEEERRLQEQARVKKLESEIAKWRLVQGAREYVAELEKRAAENRDSSIEEWVRWIHSFVERSDPFK